jgi:hypothetical protein
MSVKVVTAFEITNFQIMEEVLQKLGYTFKKQDSQLIINKPYYDIIISKNEVSCDSMNKTEIEKIMWSYQKEFQIKERILRGETYNVVETEDEVVIIVE